MIKIIDINFLGTSSAIACFLIESDQELILIETGPSTVYNNLKKSIEGFGYDIKKIKHIFVTHIHLDHSGGAWRFAENGAKIYVHPNGMKHLIDPSKLIHSASKIYKDKMIMLWGKIKNIKKENVQSVKHREKIKVGNIVVESLHTPGHANHHIAWKVDQNIFTGDVAGAKIKSGPVLPACPPPEVDIEKWIESLELIKKENPKVLYLTHFGKSTNVVSHIDEMKKRLKSWSLWIKKNSSNNNTEELTEKFNKYVSAFLRDEAKISNKLIEQYYTANPPYMSVSGLLRYWDKKNKN
tara:strand:+ start:2442 stop:3329 length:888 start_codon:yes stop_codon:yes gene_type:complete